MKTSIRDAIQLTWALLVDTSVQKIQLNKKLLTTLQHTMVNRKCNSLAVVSNLAELNMVCQLQQRVLLRERDLRRHRRQAGFRTDSKCNKQPGDTSGGASVQGDQAACPKLPVDIDLKVAF